MLGNPVTSSLSPRSAGLSGADAAEEEPARCQPVVAQPDVPWERRRARHRCPPDECFPPDGLAPGDDSDEQARWIEATVVGKQAIRVCGLYLPNGNPAPGPKYDYKLAWMARLQARAEALLAEETPFLMAGDYNIIPQDEDARRPEVWQEDALARPESRAAYRRLVNLGLTEAFRTRVHGPEHYSFWDYQAGAWNKDDGIRIDHFLLSPAVADILVDCQIDKHVRAGEKPSDHVPVWVELGN